MADQLLIQGVKFNRYRILQGSMIHLFFFLTAAFLLYIRDYRAAALIVFVMFLEFLASLIYTSKKHRLRVLSRKVFLVAFFRMLTIPTSMIG